MRWDQMIRGKHGPQHGTTHMLAESTLVCKIAPLIKWPTFALEKNTLRASNPWFHASGFPL